MKNVTVLRRGELLSGGVTRLLSGTLTVGSTLESKRGFGSPKQKINKNIYIFILKCVPELRWSRQNIST